MKYYWNTSITIITAVAYTIEYSDLNTLVYIKVVLTVIFAALALWVFSIGFLVTLGQFIYGLVKYFNGVNKVAAYLQHCYAAGIAVLGYILIFIISVGQL